MSRQIRRACDRTAGFTFVELLVTIIIAGIAFAAIVPLFVMASGKNSADNARNVALQVAQDKIEKIRQLDYEQIVADASDMSSEPNLYNESFAGGQFGPHWDFTRNGSSKRYTIQYTVTPVLSATGQEKYKKVVVRVTWTAPPSPVKAAILQTLVYRQYAGPVIQLVNVGPPSIFDPNPDVTTIIDSPVVVDVQISPEDVASMNATATDPDDRGWVKFTVTSFTGVTVASEEVNAVYNGELGHYQFIWDNSTAMDGVYKIEMTAFSATEMQGSTATLAFNLDNIQPPAPTGVTALPGDGLVSLSWDPAGIGDFDHYELWRSTSSGTETRYIDDLDTPSYIDTGLTNLTTYYYQVLVVDTDGIASELSAQVSATPDVQSDNQPPGVPTGLSAIKVTGSQTINLAWAPSIDAGTPTHDVFYVIQRSDGVSDWSLGQLDGSYPNTAYPDSSAGWGATWYYRVAAIDAVGNMSAFSAPVGPVTTDPQPHYSLTVSNTQGTTIYVWVQNVGTGLWYATNGTSQVGKPSGVDIKKNKQKIWSNLPSGVYNVSASVNASGSPALPSQSGSGDLSAGNNTIQF